jgi:hypothetical protein
MTKVKGGYGRVVWMPTFDSEHNAAPEHRPFARVAKDGKLVPEVVQVSGSSRSTAWCWRRAIPRRLKP